MRIIHLSYAHVPDYDDPQTWLNRLSFFTVLLETTAHRAEVKSIHLISYSGVVEQRGVEYHFLRRSRREILFPIRIHRYLKNLEPDIVVVHGLVFPLQVLLLRSQLGPRVKITMIHHAERPLRHHKGLFQRLADKFIDAYFFNSMELAKIWIDSGLIKNSSRVHEVMIGSSVFYPVDRKLAKSITGVHGSQMYLWVGHLDENKDPVTLVIGFREFVKSYPDKKLYLIYQQESLLEKIKPLVIGCDQIELIGKVKHSELLYWYNSVDFIISTSHYEGGGTAVCEGMSCGCFPILTSIPSFLMMTDRGEVGCLFEPGNVRDLTIALHKSLTHDLNLERQRVLDHFREKLSNEAIVQKMMSVFKSI